MKIKVLFVILGVLAFNSFSGAQTRKPSVASSPFVVKTQQQIDDIQKDLAKQSGNKARGHRSASRNQTRIAIFHDEKRVDDMVELHDGSDDYYYVLDGTAILMLGGTLDVPKRSRRVNGAARRRPAAKRSTIKKGDLIFVPRGTPHQRTVTGKGFSMILVKIFAEPQPAK